MAKTPAIQAPRTLDLKQVQTLADNVRQRLESVETIADKAAASISASAKSSDQTDLKYQVAQLQTTVNSLSSAVTGMQAIIAAISALPAGILVKTTAGATFASRTLQAGEGIAIDNADGVSGDPKIYFSTKASPLFNEDWYEVPAEEETWLLTP